MSEPGKIKRLRLWTRLPGLLCTLILTFAFSKCGLAQTLVDTPRANVVQLAPDTSLSVVTDTASADSASRASLEDSLGIRISPDALPSRVVATANDSAVLDLETNLFYL